MACPNGLANVLPNHHQVVIGTRKAGATDILNPHADQWLIWFLLVW